jgi:hypothetical protein
MLAGALAGSATVLITNPIWVVNTRMTARKSDSDEQVLPGAPPAKKPSTLGTLLALLREEGPSRLFAGVMPALVLVINPILQYTVFEQMKNYLEKRRRVTPTDAFYLGALGKLLATSITYPYITVKSRMHVAGKDGPKENMLTTFRRIIREEGYAGFYGGKLLHSQNQTTGNDVLMTDRNRAQGYAERHHGGVLVRFQGCVVCVYCFRTQENCAQAVGNMSLARDRSFNDLSPVEKLGSYGSSVGCDVQEPDIPVWKISRTTRDVSKLYIHVNSMFLYVHILRSKRRDIMRSMQRETNLGHSTG